MTLCNTVDVVHSLMQSCVFPIVVGTHAQELVVFVHIIVSFAFTVSPVRPAFFSLATFQQLVRLVAVGR